MKKLIYVILITLLFIPTILFASEKDINIYWFHGKECPHCQEEKVFLDKYLDKHKNVHLVDYEVWHNDENMVKFTEVAKLLDEKTSGVPFLIIGNNSVVGYIDGYTDEVITNTINYYLANNYVDGVGIYLGVVDGNIDDWDKNIKYIENEDELVVPDNLENIVKNSSLLVSAIVIGFIDGLNPCAMWILLFLISMLFSIRSKKKRWLIGSAFLISSALVYFLFLLSWIDISVYLTKITYIRLGIAAIAVIFGAYSIIRFINNIGKEDGCEVVNSKNRRRIISAIKKIVKEKSIFVAILGVALLAVSVNIIELLCSLGLPVLFTQLLVLNEVNTFWKFIYSFVYVFFFLIDDTIIFIIAMKTLEIKTISNKVGKYAHLIGGILMLLIGVLMLFKPDWLMLNF